MVNPMSPEEATSPGGRQRAHRSSKQLQQHHQFPRADLGRDGGTVMTRRNGYLPSLAEAALRSERAVIGALINQPHRFPEVELSTTDFGLTFLREVFAAMAARHEDGKKWDLILMQQGLGTLDAAYLEDLTWGVPRDIALAEHVACIRTAARRRAIAGRLERGAQQVEDQTEDLDTLVTELCADLRSLGEETPRKTLDIVTLADVAPRAVEWFWKPYIPFGMTTMLSGDPSAGKSYICLAAAAELSRGKLLDGRHVEPATTLYLTHENPLPEVMRPRFDLFDGDPTRLKVLKGHHVMVGGEAVSLPLTLADVGTLGQALRETGARLIVVDPVQSYLGANVDINRTNETRPILDGLADLADRCRCANMIVRHLTKVGGGKAIYRGQGSIDLTGAARSELLAGPIPDVPNTYALAHIKTNVGPKGHALQYTIDEEGRFAWGGESSVSVDELLSGTKEKKVTTASDWLRELLRDGWTSVNEIEDRGKEAGYSWMTLRRAKDERNSGIRTRKGGYKEGWGWELK
jgi:hypothetical protein